MQDLLNIDALSLSLATGLATALVFALKALFALARGWAKRTPTALDDRIVDQTQAALRDKSREL